jgi:uncharacterized membrane protein YphA (DoxX/SURF4 family)
MPQKPSPGRFVAVLTPVLGAVMILSGAAKLAGEAHAVAGFATWGLPTWFLALVGTFEVLGGLFLLLPATTPIGSLILSTVMVGAVWVHVAYREWPHLLTVSVLLGLFLAIFRRNQSRAIRLMGGA